MPVLRIIGTTQVIVGGVLVSLTATLEQDDVNGQIFVRVQGVAGQDTIDERASIGSADGNDALSGMTQAEIQVAIQKVLDGLRPRVGQRLATLAKIKNVAANLT